jgi:hypothetical protein
MASSAVAWFIAEMKPADWIAAVSAFATLAGVVVVFLQLRGLARQITLQHFADYTKRYQNIILEFPEDINAPNFKLAGRPDYDRTMRRMRAYFDLSFEEWNLDRDKLIDSRVWKVWKGGILTALSKPAFQQAWQIIKTDTTFGPKFESFVEHCIRAEGDVDRLR